MNRDPQAPGVGRALDGLRRRAQRLGLLEVAGEARLHSIGRHVDRRAWARAERQLEALPTWLRSHPWLAMRLRSLRAAVHLGRGDTAKGLALLRRITRELHARRRGLPGPWLRTTFALHHLDPHLALVDALLERGHARDRREALATLNQLALDRFSAARAPAAVDKRTAGLRARLEAAYARLASPPRGTRGAALTQTGRSHARGARSSTGSRSPLAYVRTDTHQPDIRGGASSTHHDRCRRAFPVASRTRRARPPAYAPVQGAGYREGLGACGNAGRTRTARGRARLPRAPRSSWSGRRSAGCLRAQSPASRPSPARAHGSAGTGGRPVRHAGAGPARRAWEILPWNTARVPRRIALYRVPANGTPDACASSRTRNPRHPQRGSHTASSCPRGGALP